MKVRSNFLNEHMDVISEAAASSKLEKNFILGELANTSGDKSLPMYEFNIGSIILVKCLQELRDKIGKPIVVNSGYRQFEYNKKIGGDTNSPHLRGWAADIRKVDGISDNSMAIFWERICSQNCEIGAINLYDTYYHLEINSDIAYGNKNFVIRDRRTK